MALKKRMQNWQIVLIGAVVVCGLFIVGVCVAKMLSDQVEIGAEERQTAKWAVSMISCSNDGVDLVAGGEVKSCSLKVTNSSEVASNYVIEVSDVPDGVKVGLGDGVLQTPTNGAISFTETGGTLGINGERSHTLRFSADLAADADEDEMTVGVSFVQKDPR